MRKNKLSALLLFCSFILLLNACAKREIKNADSKGKNIICFGDSITFGYGARPREGYPAELGRLVNMPVINAGIDGDISSEGLKRLHSDVLDREPFLVIIEFGGNDFLRKVPKELTLKNVSEMIKRCQAKGAMVALADVSAGPFLKEYRVAFRKIARQEGAIFIPAILSEIVTKSHLKSDFVHPNAEGYKMIAQKVYLAIKPYLKSSVNK